MKNNQPLTKKDLEEALESFAGIVNVGFQEAHDSFKEIHDNFKAVHNNFKEVHERINNTDVKIETATRETLASTDAKLETATREILANTDVKIESVKQELLEMKRELLDSNAAIAKQVADNQQEQAAIIGGHARISDTLLEHEERIVRLERVGSER